MLTKSVARQDQFPESGGCLVQGQFVCSASIIADDVQLLRLHCDRVCELSLMKKLCIIKPNLKCTFDIGAVFSDKTD